MKRIMRPCPNCGLIKYEAIQYNCTVTTPIVGVDDDLEAVRFDTAAVSIDTEDAEVTFQCAVCGKEVVCGSDEDFIDEIGEINFKSAAKIDRQALRKNVPTLAKDKNLLYTGTEEEFINYMIKNNGAYEDSLAVIADYIKSIIPTDKIINIDCVGTSLRLDMSDKKTYYISIGETPQ